MSKTCLNWNTFEWKLFAFTFSVFVLYPLMNGYPFLFPDSWSYASGQCPDGIRSPVIGCVMRPAVVIGGTWGYIIVQSAITAFTLVCLAKVFGHKKLTHTYFVPIIISGVGLFSGYLMADVWTLIGLIWIYLISLGYYSVIISVLLAVSSAAHYGNFPIFAAAALLFIPFVQNKIKFIAVVISSTLLGVVLIFGANLLGRDLRVGPKMGGASLLASRILHDMPEVIEKKCQVDPDFGICEIKENILHWGRDKSYELLVWQGKTLLGVSWEELELLSRDLVFYSIKEFPVKHAYILIRNTLRAAFGYKLSSGFPSVRGKDWYISGFEKHFPDDLDNFENSWQATGRLKSILKNIEKPLSLLFSFCMIICLAGVVYWRKHFRENLIISLSIFALISVIINALFTSVFSGVYGRYHTRIGFLLFFPSYMLLCKWIAEFKNKISDRS